MVSLSVGDGEVEDAIETEAHIGPEAISDLEAVLMLILNILTSLSSR